MPQTRVVTRTPESALATNKVLRNTYMLLAMTLLFSAACAMLSVFIAPPYPLAMGASLVALGLLWFVLPRVDESSAGIGVVFAVTGLLGFGIGPMLSAYLSLANGPTLVATAMGGTGAIFLALSA
ncbi:MAG: BAX inhibitor protein, partial [Gammaproteobacteria bacterium]